MTAPRPSEIAVTARLADLDSQIAGAHELIGKLFVECNALRIRILELEHAQNRPVIIDGTLIGKLNFSRTPPQDGEPGGE